IRNSVFVWPNDEANVPIPPNGLAPSPLRHMPFGMTGSERILLSTLDRQYQIKILTLNLSIINLNFSACKAEVDATIADIRSIVWEILLRSEYYKEAKRGPHIAAAREMMKEAIPEANSLKKSTARLSSLLATLSQSRLESINSFEAWQEAM